MPVTVKLRAPTGKRNVYVEFQTAATTVATSGSAAVSYTPLYRRWVAFRDYRSREVIVGDQVQGQRMVSVFADYDTALMAVKSSARLVTIEDVPRTFNLSGPPMDVDEMHREIMFDCVQAE